MTAAARFDAVFEALREIMIPYSGDLVVVEDEPGSLHLDTKHVMKNGKPLFFGAVQIRKRYVSYHLMPVYVEPSLLKNMSAELKNRMQGKSCLNFTAIDDVLFDELDRLTRSGFDYYKSEGYV